MGPDGPRAILVAARDEEERIAGTVRALSEQFPGARVVVGDDGSRDRTAELAGSAGAQVVRCHRLGKGEALNAAERAAPRGPVVLADADVVGDLRPLVRADADLVVAAFAARVGGGLGLAKGVGRELVRMRTALALREPLSGQRYLSERARAACFPLARGFGCEVRMTIDAARSGLRVVEVELPLVHRATRRDAAGFAHRGRQLLEAALGAGPLAENHRGNRLPLVGAVTVLGGIGAPVRTALAVGAVAAIGLADDVWSGTERGWRAHLSAGRTTGVLKLVGIPIVGGWATRSITGGVLVGLAANAVNVLDTRPGRALKAFGAASLAVRAVPPGYRAVAVMLLPYDLRERGMLGDGGSNAFGAVLGLAAVSGSSTRARLALVAGLAGLNVAAEAVSLGRLIERTPVLRELDALGRIA